MFMSGYFHMYILIQTVSKWTTTCLVACTNQIHPCLHMPWSFNLTFLIHTSLVWMKVFVREICCAGCVSPVRDRVAGGNHLHPGNFQTSYLVRSKKSSQQLYELAQKENVSQKISLATKILYVLSSLEFSLSAILITGRGNVWITD